MTVIVMAFGWSLGAAGRPLGLGTGMSKAENRGSGAQAPGKDPHYSSSDDDNN